MALSSRLEAAGVVEIKWEEDEEGNVFAEGLQSYEVDVNNELAVFHDDKCVRTYQCADLCHAVAMIYAGEGVCRWNLKNGKTGNGNAINEKGWDTGKRYRG